MKARPSVKPMCEYCRVTRCKGCTMVTYSVNPKHKQCQG